MKKLSKISILTLLIVCVSFVVNAQTYEEEMKKMQEEQEKSMKSMQNEYEDYIKKEQLAFENYIKQSDAEFSQYLKGQWDAFAVLKGQKQNTNPGPTTIPTFDPAAISKKDVKSFSISKKDVEMAPRQDQTLGLPVLPDEQVLNDKSFPSNNGNINFYGVNIGFNYDENLSKQFSGNIDEKNISSYWDEVCKAKYFPLIDQLLGFKTKYSLNDWGYYMLVKNMSNEITKSKNSGTLLTWFLMIKSGYKIKVGYSENSIYLMLPSNTTMYGMSYFTFNGLSYYVPDLKGEKIYTYKKDFPDARLIMDFNLSNPVNLGTEIGERAVKFKYDDKEYNLKIKYNKSLMKFYDEYPQCEIGIFFNASISSIAKESLIENLKPLIEGKSQIDAVNLLLTFVQTGFEYKTDQDQFNREKFFLAEEVLFYPFCDCEDRSVFFSFLVKELLGMDVIGLNYPDHISSAVYFTDKVEGDAIVYKEKKYIISDPTYINAPVGLSMPMYKDVKPLLVEVDNLQNKEQQKRSIWDKIYACGGNRGDNGQDIVFDDAGNSYVTGYFAGEAAFGSFKMKTEKDSKDIFIAKLDKKGNFIWAKQAQGKGNEIAYGIGLDKSGNAMITGSFDNAVSFGEKSLKTNGKPDVFCTKYSKDGQVVWANKVGFDSLTDKLPNKVYLANFNNAGKLIDKKFFNETEYFDKFGVMVDSLGTTHITGSFSTALSMTTKNDVVTNTAAQVDFASSWSQMSSKLLESNYSPEIAGLFAFIQSIRLVGSRVEGKAIQDAIDKTSPDFKTASSKVYNSLGELTLIKNSSGIISINTNSGQPMQLSAIKIDNNSKIKFVTYEDGNSRINVLNGLSFSKGVMKYDLNFIKIFKDNGDLLLDYDADNTQKKINMKKDIME